MKRSLTICFFAFFFTIAFAPALFATTANIQICIEYEVLWDEQQGDYFTNNDPLPAWGIWLKVQRHLGGGNYTTIHNDYLLYSGDDKGCTDGTLSLDTENEYKITALAKASVDYSNKAFIYDDDEEWEIHTQVLAADWSPETQHYYIYTFSYELVSPSMVSNILAASSYSLKRRRGGLSGETYNYFTISCDGGSCLSKSSDGIKLAVGHRGNKFVISHELGHYILWKWTDIDAWVNDCSFDQIAGDCQDGTDLHRWFSKEKQSCAAMEGLADFYSAAVWNYNSGSGSDCEYEDKDCALDSSANPTSAYLETRPCPLLWYAKSTECDWTNFWWDMYTEEGLSVADVFEIYDEVSINGHTIEDWEENEVYYGLRASAISNGVDSDDWWDWADYNSSLRPNGNGINH